MSVIADDLRALSEGSARLDSYARNAAVLVVDDEPGMRNFLSKALKPHCALVETADSAETAEALRRRYHFDLMILDIRLPGRSGVEWLDELRTQDVRSDVIVMTAYADLETAIQALRAGAADFLLKPFRLEQIISAVNSCLERRRTARENFLLKRQTPKTSLDGIVGGTQAIGEVVDVIQRVAPTHATVLVEGETGTGKELVARSIHDLSDRQGPFVPVNCGSISPDLLESELFGHVRGAFTSAHSSREGLFSFAHGGTLFLDEISEMSLSMQAKLLRALETKSIRPVGADREVPVNVRVIAATNRRLSAEVEADRFREDLFFRLNVLAITVPPLRERAEDIAELARHFSQELSDELRVPPVPLSHEDIMKLKAYDWPGNVRELRNVIERSLLLGKLPGEFFGEGGERPGGAESSHAAALPLDWSMAEVEKHHMLRVLEGMHGNKTRAAKSLGVSRKTLERKLKGWQQES
ncbi:MAG TPA: sigma-54 dependent transcriptional regulator [Gammaproteobacteria bacterium]|nr:sigma-54 dependent transcriptional regulator [Gammaproteobacteria bacterium]